MKKPETQWVVIVYHESSVDPSVNMENGSHNTFDQNSLRQKIWKNRKYKTCWEKWHFPDNPVQCQLFRHKGAKCGSLFSDIHSHFSPISVTLTPPPPPSPSLPLPALWTKAEPRLAKAATSVCERREGDGRTSQLGVAQSGRQRDWPMSIRATPLGAELLTGRMWSESWWRAEMAVMWIYC